MVEPIGVQEVTTPELKQDCGCGCGGEFCGTAKQDCGCGCGGHLCGCSQQELVLVELAQVVKMRQRTAFKACD